MGLRWLAGVLVLSLLAGCALAPGTEPPRGAPLVLDPAMQQTVQSVLKDYQPSPVSVSVSRVQEIYTRGVSVTHHQTRSSHTRQETGAWTDVTISRWLERGEVTTAHALHLCGLVVLVNAVTTGSVGIKDDVFVPHGIHSPFGMGVWPRAAKLEVTTANLCSPAAGETFTVRGEFEVWAKTYYSMVGTIRSRNSVDLTCVGAAQAKPARELGVPVSGEALLFSCERSSASGPKETSEHIFVRELGMYVLKSRGEPGDARTTTVRYESAEGRL
jgi:hypothetical protein